MSNQNTTSAGGGAGRAIIWALLALALAAIAYLTLFLAIPNNPLYSDREAYGISKYQFLEECHDVFEKEINKEGGIGEQIRTARQLSTDVEFFGGPEEHSEKVVKRIETVPVNDEGLVDLAGTRQSWAIARIPMLIESHDVEMAAIPVGMQCVYNPKLNIVEVMVQ